MLQSINRTRFSLFAFIAFIFPLLVTQSCSDSSDDETSTIGNWTKTTPFKGRPRSGAICFTIGSKAFVGLGYDGDEYINDFYVYDLSKGYWESKATFPGLSRERAVAFSVGGKGYIGLGYNRDEDKEELGDFWEYDPDTNTWTEVANFGGTARYNAVAFAIGDKAYVGTGYDGDKYNSDFWEYDVVNNSWKEIASFPGEKIEGGFSFVVNGKAYVAGGRNNGLYNRYFWEFNPSDLSWVNRTPDSDESYYTEFTSAVQRHDAVALTIDGYAYVIGGYSSSGAVDNSVYIFNPLDNSWDSRTSFEGSARSLAVGYVLDSRAFVGTGQNGTSKYDDIWEFKPAEAYDDSN
jgi:N-acetylneuraminic acid mutarotase